MKPVIFSLIAMIFFAVSNTMLEMKFSKYNNLTLMSAYSFVICVFATMTRLVVKKEDPSFLFPTGTNLALLFLMGLLFAIADYFYVGAYTNGGSLLTVTSITIMFPIFASVIKFLVAKQVPNKWQFAGYILAACAILMVVKGNKTPQ